jgi:hypothetical protein
MAPALGPLDQWRLHHSFRPPKSLAGTQQTDLVNPLNLFEFFFDWRKQVEVTGGEIG